jgi:hypothetical protein
MTPLVLALAVAGQYPTPQAPQYGAPAQYAAPVTYSAPQTYSIPVTYAAPQVVTLGAGQVIPPSPLGLLLGHIGRSLEKHSWPRVQPMAAQPAAVQTIYLQIAPPQIQQAVYTVAQPSYQLQATPPPLQLQYAAQPQLPAKSPPPQQQYGTPQSAGYGAARPSESVPPVPNR